MAAGLLFGLALALMAPDLLEAASANSCVECHGKLPLATFVGRRYVLWAGSIHARLGITCDICHGGKPTYTQKTLAHRGVYNSGRPQARTYFKKVPKLCGGCHRAELRHFKRSIHYKELMTTGRGPNCVTCHESKTGSIVSPSELVETCSVCHNERLAIEPRIPLRAYGVLLKMAFASDIEQALRQLVALAGSKGSKHLESARLQLREARAQWHTFSLRKVERFVERALESLRTAREKAKTSKGPSQAAHSKSPSKAASGDL
jgi:hypothetical protein